MPRTTVKLAVLAAAAALLSLTQPAGATPTGATAHRGAAASEAYFEFDYPPSPDKVVFKLTDTAKIQEARNIVNGTQKDRTHVIGRIVKRPESYNPGWSFHLDPASISFFQVAIEVCDAAPRYVEDHLDEAGGAFLPGAHWCPWNSRLLREVPAPQTS
ncbi:calmodulin [Planomonospora sphaerica]|uniref:Calmodulin n=1 Tax=Planomonospora sphaerica TaxID=161355 RepID=A0A171DKF4_9ACTN|nr:calmodulin-binding protein [Planomonospora sphaerica]GAT69307.1 calmodulin [Planomonospora sphaerica]